MPRLREHKKNVKKLDNGYGFYANGAVRLKNNDDERIAATIIIGTPAVIYSTLIYFHHLWYFYYYCQKQQVLVPVVVVHIALEISNPFQQSCKFVVLVDIPIVRFVARLKGILVVVQMTERHYTLFEFQLYHQYDHLLPVEYALGFLFSFYISWMFVKYSRRQVARHQGFIYRILYAFIKCAVQAHRERYLTKYVNLEFLNVLLFTSHQNPSYFDVMLLYYQKQSINQSEKQNFKVNQKTILWLFLSWQFHQILYRLIDVNVYRYQHFSHFFIILVVSYFQRRMVSAYRGSGLRKKGNNFGKSLILL